MEFKPQDLLFLGALVILFLKRDPKFFVIAGLVCLVLAIHFYIWRYPILDRRSCNSPYNLYSCAKTGKKIYCMVRLWSLAISCDKLVYS